MWDKGCQILKLSMIVGVWNKLEIQHVFGLKTEWDTDQLGDLDVGGQLVL